MDYKNSGVDIEAGYKSVELMKKYVQGTMRPEVLTGLGGFSGAFSMEKFKNMEKPTLVSGTDGVGTKIKLAFLMDKHDTIGIDCVAMCVNDIACAGGEPLFFLDYIACGKNYPEKIASIVSGVAEGCKQSDAALIGGETAEHPGLMPEDEYDLAGFAVGVVDEKDIITGADLKAGDVLIGMASSGVHSNGFSLVRKIFEMTKESLDTYYDELGKTLGEALLVPTRIYVKALRSAVVDFLLHESPSFLTGGEEMRPGQFSGPPCSSCSPCPLTVRIPSSVVAVILSRWATAISFFTAPSTTPPQIIRTWERRSISRAMSIPSLCSRGIASSMNSGRYRRGQIGEKPASYTARQ